MDIQPVINRKSLEKQLKIVQSKLELVEAERLELQKVKDACLTLLETFGDPSVEKEAEQERSKKEKVEDSIDTVPLETDSALEEAQVN